MKWLTEAKIKDQRVLVRVDFNVDLDEKGKILSDFRLRAVLPTLHYLLEKGAKKIILISHLGRPEKREEKYSLKPLGEHLQKLLNKEVVFLPDCRGEAIKKAIEQSSATLFLLENLRFYPEEEANEKKFAQELAELGDLYINDAFGVSHRENASVVAITEFLESYGGLLLEKEIKNLDRVLKDYQRPLVLVLGGAKISTKLPLIKKFLEIGDFILVGGALANTILKAWDFKVGRSLIEKEMLKEAKNLGSQKAELILPGDFLTGDDLKTSRAKKRGLGEVKNKELILDIGPIASETYAKIIKKAKTIVWNGPMGYFENPIFSQGTNKVAQAIAEAKAFKVAGGGETLIVLERLKLLEKMSFVSTGGGAMLEYLAGQELVGLKALER